MSYPLFICVFLAIIIYHLFYEFKKMYYSTRVLSKIDNKYYLVRNVNKTYNQQAADTLAKLNVNIQKLIKHLNSIDSKQFKKNVDLLNYRFNPNTLIENILKIDTSFTINKGESMEFCLDKPHTPDFVDTDFNTLIYVALHEISHTASITYDHTPEFKRNFAFIVDNAIKCGIYRYQDYSKFPAEHCGIPIKHNII